MRVQGNKYPETVTVEAYLPVSGSVEVRLRENVSQISQNMFEYDEYVLITADRPGLKEEIAGNLQNWMETLRTLEVNEKASILREARDENSALIANMAQLIDEVYTSDIVTI